MDEQDAFFTHAIVGAPFSLMLGRRLGTQEAKAQGLQIDLHDGSTRLSPDWQPWWRIQRANERPAGTPQPRPQALRRWLERQALAIAAAGLLALLCGLLLTAAALMRGLPW